jgi:hypothetical protein
MVTKSRKTSDRMLKYLLLKNIKKRKNYGRTKYTNLVAK